jgi:predicted dehydrogenase
MSDKPLRVCIVGCGYMGNIHADGWAQVPEAEVVAVVDIIEERASKLAEKFGLERFYTDYREAIDLPAGQRCFGLHPHMPARGRLDLCHAAR